jgi:RimJ/RimL family protein N-acetyltransferase
MTVVIIKVHIPSEKNAELLALTLGMRKEAHLKEHRFFKGQWWDTVIMGVLCSEWFDF